MDSETRNPWHRRSLPPWLPVWLVLSILAATAGGYLATWSREHTPRMVLIGCGVGFFAGLVFSMAMAARLERVDAPAKSHFRPPIWVSLPASVALLHLIAYALIDETVRQGYYDGYGGRRLRYFRIPGPLAVGLSCCCVIGAGVISIGNVWRRNRYTPKFLGGVLGSIVLLIGVSVILKRVLAAN